MQVFSIPSVADQMRSEPVQKLGMRWRIGAESKVTWCFDQSTTEVVHPNTVDPDSRRERIVGRYNSASEFQSPTAVLEGKTISRRKQTGKLSRYNASFVGRVSTTKYLRINGVWSVSEYQRVRSRFRLTD